MGAFVLRSEGARVVPYTLYFYTGTRHQGILVPMNVDMANERVHKLPFPMREFGRIPAALGAHS